MDTLIYQKITMTDGVTHIIGSGKISRIGLKSNYVFKTGLNGIDYAINVDNQRAYKILGQ